MTAILHAAGAVAIVRIPRMLKAECVAEFMTCDPELAGAVATIKAARGIVSWVQPDQLSGTRHVFPCAAAVRRVGGARRVDPLKVHR